MGFDGSTGHGFDEFGVGIPAIGAFPDFSSEEAAFACGLVRDVGDEFRHRFAGFGDDDFFACRRLLHQTGKVGLGFLDVFHKKVWSGLVYLSNFDFENKMDAGHCGK